MAKASPQRKKGGWRKLEVDDQFLRELEEPGFQELEVVSAADMSLLGDDGLQGLIAQADAELAAQRTSAGAGATQAAAAEGEQSKKGKKVRKKRKRQQEPSDPTTAPDVDSPEADLRARIAALEAENAELRSAPGGVLATSGSGAAGDASAAVSHDDTNGAVGAAAAEQVDMSAWDDYGLDELVVQALAAQSFTSPTPIQHECLPAAVLGNADLIGAAQTGSGKTLAFGLPIVNLLVREARERADAAAAGEPLRARLQGGRNKLRALVLCPTRELAMQVCAHITAIAKPLAIRVVPIVGGVSPQKQQRLLGYRPPIVVATPGRLWDVMRNGNAHLSDLTHLSCLVLDEADRMVKQGHYEELTHILDAIPKPHAAAASAPPAATLPYDAAKVEAGLPADVAKAALAGALRTYVFSATLTLPDALKERLQRGHGGSRGSGAGATFDSLMNRIAFRGKPKIADLTSEQRLADGLTDAFISCDEDERDAMLAYILTVHPGRTLVFLNAISGIRRVAALLKLLGIPAQVLHAQQQQRQRFKALERFKHDANSVLVATDVAARGLDIPAVRCVVQYQLPPTADTYIHRAGRTARAERDGLNVAFVVPSEAPRYRGLHVALAREPAPPFPVDRALLPDVAARVKLAARVDELERAQRKGDADINWMAKHAKEAEIEFDAGAAKSNKAPKQRGVTDTDLAVRLRGELAAMLAEPLRQRVNARFFTGGTSQLVAASLLDGERANEAAARGTEGVTGAMQESIALAEAVVAKRVADSAPTRGGGAKRKAPSLAQCRQQALERALQAKQRKKAGSKGVVRSAKSGVSARNTLGAEALAQLRAM